MQPVDPDAFDALVADALDEIPEALAAEMDNVIVVVEEWPTAEQRAAHDGEGGGGLLGLYEGVPLIDRGPTSYALVAPDRITIFSGPLCARARDLADLTDEVRTTVLHEVGHHFGMTDAELTELGWA